MMQTKIYVLSGPDGVVRYVGKTSKTLETRLAKHLGEARLGKKTHRFHWIRSLPAPPEITLLHVVEGNGSSAETASIAALRGAGYDLVNGTDGGEGGYGHRPSAETLEKMRAAGRRRVISPETREKMRLARMGLPRKPHSAETRLKMSKSAAGKPRPLHSAETKAKMAATAKRAHKTPEHLAKLAVAACRRGAAQKAARFFEMLVATASAVQR